MRRELWESTKQKRGTLTGAALLGLEGVRGLKVCGRARLLEAGEGLLLEAGVGADAGEVRAVCWEAGGEGQDVVSNKYHVRERRHAEGWGRERVLTRRCSQPQ